ncbi:MAG: hypothetical protein J7L77_08350, partial [Clostridiales bacterium]|nr:hypothetical protein [Clostridiales bacterium]
MKKLILFFMIFLIFLSGCNGNSDRNNSEKPDIEVSNIPVITNSDGTAIETIPPLNANDQLPEIFEPVNLLSIYQPAHSSREKYFNLDAWQRYIYDKFGIEINMTYKSSINSSVYYFNC